MTTPPRIEPRRHAALLADLLARAPGYVGEWTPHSGGGGHALMAILARYLELQAQALDRVPDRMRLAFLDALGNGLLPARAARAPVVFKLMSTAPLDVTLPRGTRVAAKLPPPPPSLTTGTQEARTDPPQFYTEQAIRLMRGGLGVVYSVDPESDSYADHTSTREDGFTLFSRMQPVPHELYLGHDEMFSLSGEAEITLSFDLAPAHERKPDRPLLLDWEYLSENGWLPLELFEDQTARMTRDGKITLRKHCGPDSKRDKIAGHDSFWIRARVSARVPSARIAPLLAGYWLQLDQKPGVDVGEQVTVDAQSSARVVALEDTLVVIDRELSGAAAGAALKRVSGGAALANIVTAYGAFRVALEDGRELLAGDKVTIDGLAVGTLPQADRRAAVVDRPLTGAALGARLMLAEALPPVRPEGLGPEGLLPRIDVIRARVGFTKSDLQADAAYTDAVRLDLSNNFMPFGLAPERFTTFYFAQREAFARRGAAVVIAVTLAQPGNGSADLRITPEYFANGAWSVLQAYHEYKDGTAGFTAPAPSASGALGTGLIRFICPDDWTETEVNNESNYWLRLRIDAGDYGHPLRVSVVDDGAGGYKVVSEPATLQPPVIAKLRLQYTYFTNPELLQHCVSYNDFAYADHSDDVRWPRRPFAPFRPIGDRYPALHIGFTSRPPSGLVSLFAHVARRAESDAQALPFIWEYRSERGWTELSVLDETAGLAGTGVIQFVGASDAVATEGLGGTLYRIRARLKPGYRVEAHRLPLAGLWLNAVWVSQGEHVERETLGVSTGNPQQTFALPPLRVPVLPGPLVEVQEWVGRGDHWTTAVQGVPEADLRIETDPRDQTTPVAVWVRWHERPHLYASGPNDRHYVVDPASGTFRFGGDGYGLVPRAGARIVASFATGGGLVGNVPAGTLTELRSGVGYVESITNPLPATGGAATERLTGGIERSTERLRHRNRAVSTEDYEWIAREASPEVVRARCLPLAGTAGRGQRGEVRVIVVPQSVDAMPLPTLALMERVLATLRANAPAGMQAGIRVEGPSYVQVSVRAEIVPLRPEDAALVEARVRARLAAYLHPLTGGADGAGWDFGEPVYLSALATLLETTEGVDYVRALQLMVGETLQGDAIEPEANMLLAAGDHQLKLIAGATLDAAA